MTIPQAIEAEKRKQAQPFPELLDWLCAGCRKMQPARDKAYGVTYCRHCTHAILMKSSLGICNSCN